jgi:hypothetical protein
MVDLKSLMDEFDIDTTAKVLDGGSKVDDVREKMCKKIDKHIKRYVDGVVEKAENKSGKVVKKKVDCLHKATDKANMRAIFLKYSDTHIPISGQEYLSVADTQEKALWGKIKELIKDGEFDSELMEASRKSSLKLQGTRGKKAKK